LALCAVAFGIGLLHRKAKKNAKIARRKAPKKHLRARFFSATHFSAPPRLLFTPGRALQRAILNETAAGALSPVAV
jgi:hypothetical protein